MQASCTRLADGHNQRAAAASHMHHSSVLAEVALHGVEAELAAVDWVLPKLSPSSRS